MSEKHSGSSERAPISSPLAMLLVLLACVLPMAMSLPAMAQAGQHLLPPRPTPTPTSPSPTDTPVVGPTDVPATPGTGTPVSPVQESSPIGARIELRLRAERVESWTRWQKLYTVVQWQDDKGQWHTVEGWQGTFDEVVDDYAQKTWWVHRADLGKGPFRWLVYAGYTATGQPDGKLLISSDEFHLPAAPDLAIIVPVVLR